MCIAYYAYRHSMRNILKGVFYAKETAFGNNRPRPVIRICFGRLRYQPRWRSGLQPEGPAQQRPGARGPDAGS